MDATAARMARFAQIKEQINKAPDLELILKRIKMGTATKEELDAFERAKKEGRQFAKGKTVAERNDQLQCSQHVGDERAVKRRQEEKDFNERVEKDKTLFAFCLMQLDMCLNKFASSGAPHGPKADALKNALREDFLADTEMRWRRGDIAGAEVWLEKYSRELIPAGLKEIAAAQSEFIAEFTRERQSAARKQLELEALKVGPDRALAEIEKSGTKLRLRISETEDEVRETVDASGVGMNELATAIFETHYDAVISALKARESWTPIEIKRPKGSKR